MMTMTEKTHPGNYKPMQVETIYEEDLERNAPPRWASYAWQDGEIVGSGYGRTREIAEQEMWTDCCAEN